MGLRRKTVHISDSIWPALFGQDVRSYRVTRGLPNDARCVGAVKDINFVALSFESDTWPEVSDGQPYPLFDIQLTADPDRPAPTLGHATHPPESPDPRDPPTPGAVV